ncbi:MAG: two-component system response regulator [Spirochaetae bacterium HGW-Spirochaetae-9]|nr:MAG: two-component system response regulator [Spirochaetae bacterium HGW-Spirochaetae-9]
MSDDPEILLVEDNPEDAEIAIRALSKYGLVERIAHVCDGKLALDFIYGRESFSARDASKKPKLILLDLKLFKVGGLETLKQLKSDPDTMQIPVVILTSSSEKCDLAESYRLGANSYLVKHVDYVKFCESIRLISFYWLRLNQLPYG